MWDNHQDRFGRDIETTDVMVLVGKGENLMSDETGKRRPRRASG